MLKGNWWTNETLAERKLENLGNNENKTEQGWWMRENKDLMIKLTFSSRV